MIKLLFDRSTLIRDADAIARVGSTFTCSDTAKLVGECKCGQGHFADAALRARRDPTNTLDLRRRFIRDIERRWRAISRIVTEAVATQDQFGLAGSSVRALQVIAMSSGRVNAFQAFIDTALADTILGMDREAWVGGYINEAYRRGYASAIKMTRAVPLHEDRATIITKLTITELQGVIEAFSQRAVRAFSDGLLSHLPPATIARTIRQAADSIGIVRSRATVQTMIVKAHSEATLDAFTLAGVKLVGVLPETVPSPGRSHAIRDVKSKTNKNKKKRNLFNVLTAGDDKVCIICEDLSENGPYTLAEARGLIPAHPSCRCALVPMDDARFAPVGDHRTIIVDYDPAELRDPNGRWTKSRAGASPITEGEAIEMAKTHRELLEAIRKKKAKEQLGEAFIGLPGEHVTIKHDELPEVEVGFGYLAFRGEPSVGQRLAPRDLTTLARDALLVDESNGVLWEVDISEVPAIVDHDSVYLPEGTVLEVVSFDSEYDLWNVRACLRNSS